MTLDEFKSWLDGFSEAIEASPTPEQWEKIKAKIATVKHASPLIPNSPNYGDGIPRWLGQDIAPWQPVLCGGQAHVGGVN